MTDELLVSSKDDRWFIPEPDMDILVYSGRGVAEEGLQYLLSSLKSSLGATYCIATITAAQLAKDPWEANCRLLILPGGSANPYFEDISHSAIEKIRRCVLQGNCRFLGICAGAYFAASKVVFEEKDNKVAVTAEYPLALLDGVAKGTLFPGSFSYEGHLSAHAVQLKAAQMDGASNLWDQVKVYYNGGCYFQFSKAAAASNPLLYHPAAYYTENDEPAIIMGKRPSEDFPRVILCGPHPEYDPAELGKNNPSLKVAQEIDASKRVLLWNWILRRFGLSTSPCDESANDVCTPLMMFHQSSEGMARIIRASDAGILQCETNRFVFTDSGGTTAHNPLTISDKLIICSGQDQHCSFKVKVFFQNLSNNRGACGACIIYGEVMDSTQTLLRENPKFADWLPSGTIVLASKQLAGRGRGKSSWISSPGCLQFTLIHNYSMDLAKSLPMSLFQCLVALAIVQAVKEKDAEYPIHIKWPNDICIKDAQGDLHKIGGILINSQTSARRDVDSATLLIGIGINVIPVPEYAHLASLNSVSRPQKTWSKEELLAAFCNRFEILGKQSMLFGFPFDEYYAHWLHSNQVVFLEEENRSVRILGINLDGYLRAKPHDEGLLSLLNPMPMTRGLSPEVLLEPDGNSFDIMRNLIKRKF